MTASPDVYRGCNAQSFRDCCDLRGVDLPPDLRLVSTTDAAGKLKKLTYDADGRVTRTALQLGSSWLTSCKSYSVTGKAISEWGPAVSAADTCPAATGTLIPITETSYDALDRTLRITKRSALGNDRITEFLYYPDDSIQSINKVLGGMETYAKYTYTPNGKVYNVADAKSNLTTYVYDGLDRLDTTYYPHPASPGWSVATDYEQNAYDVNGNVITHRRRNGQVINQAFDNLNRLVTRTMPNAADSVQYTYDLRGLKTLTQYSNGSHTLSYAWDNAGRLLSTTAAGKTISHQYDAAGNRTRTTWPDAFYVTTDYDALNRPVSIKENGSTALVSYSYDDLSRRILATLGNGTSTQPQYDAHSALASLEHFLAGTAQDVKFTYTRNQLQDITGLATTNNLYQWNPVVGSTAYATNGLNQYTSVAGSAIQHDALGNLTGDGTWTYVYDTTNRLRTASKTGFTAALNYDPENRLTQTNLGGAVTNFLYDGDKLIAEYDSANALQKRYVHGPGVDEPIVQYDGPTTTNKNWFYADHQGSIIATANTTGTSTATYNYGPFGEPNTATGTRFRYTGQQWIAPLGLYYYKARIYSPTLGRFLQTDPIGYEDDMNLYAYVGNNSVNRVDSTGQYGTAVGLFLAGVGIDIGAQMLVEGKSWANVNLTDAMLSGASAAVTGLTAGHLAQAAYRGAISVGTAIFRTSATGAVAGGAAAMMGNIINGKAPELDKTLINVVGGGMGASVGAKLATASASTLNRMAAYGGVATAVADTTRSAVAFGRSFQVGGGVGESIGGLFLDSASAGLTKFAENKFTGVSQTSSK